MDFLNELSIGGQRSKSIMFSPEPEDIHPDPEIMQPPPQNSSSKSHSRKKPAGHIPRPPNAFILFRSDFVQKNRVPASVEKNHQNLSRIAGKVWGDMSVMEKSEWYTRAAEEKERHARKYPDYQFSPTDPVTMGHRRKVKKGRSEGEIQAVNRRCKTVAELVVKGQSGEALEQAMKEVELAKPVSPITPSTPFLSRKKVRPSSQSSLDDEDQVHSSTSTLPLSPDADQLSSFAQVSL